MSIQEDIKAFVDGELSPEMADTVRQEIDRDPALAQQAAHYRLMSDEIRAMAVEPRVAGVEQVLERFQPRGMFRRVALIAVPVLVALIVVVIFPPVFAQSKSAAKRSMQMAAAAAKAGPMEAFKDDQPSSAADESATPGTAGTAGAASSAASVEAPTVTLKNPIANVPMEAQAPSTEVNGYQRGMGRSNVYMEAQQVHHAVGRAPTRAAAPPAAAKAIPTPGRMIVENGTIELVVDDVSRAQSEAMNYARSIGGFASNSSLDKDSTDGTSSAQLTLRVPVAHFEAAMDHLKHMAKTPADITGVHVTGQDVTGQYADTTARLKVLRAEEDSYVGMLRNVRHLEDVLTVKDRLSDVRQQIESLQSQAAAFKDTSALSTIEATFDQRAKPKPKPVAEDLAPQGWVDAAWTDAKSGMGATTRAIATWSIYLFVYSPIWVPLAFLGWLGVKRWA